MQTKQYLILRLLVKKYGKDAVINTVNNSTIFCIGSDKLDHIYVDFQIKYNYEESKNIKIGRNLYTDEFKKQIVLLYQNSKTFLKFLNNIRCQNQLYIS